MAFQVDGVSNLRQQMAERPFDTHEGTSLCMVGGHLKRVNMRPLSVKMGIPGGCGPI
jgi:hypothetical protein